MIFVSLLLFFNLITFGITAYDKYKARRGYWRTRERIFLMLACFGGGAGVLSAFYFFRHKTRKRGLMAGVWTLTLVSYCTFVLVLLTVGYWRK